MKPRKSHWSDRQPSFDRRKKISVRTSNPKYEPFEHDRRGPIEIRPISVSEVKVMLIHPDSHEAKFPTIPGVKITPDWREINEVDDNWDTVRKSAIEWTIHYHPDFKTYVQSAIDTLYIIYA